MTIEVSLKDENGKLVEQTVWYRNYEEEYVQYMGVMIRDTLIPVADALIDKLVRDWESDLADG